MESPEYGTLKIRDVLCRQEGIGDEHKVYPYLLRKMAIERSNQVWCTDITYIRLSHGFVYIVAVMDWYSRKIERAG